MTTTPTASPELPDLAACPFCGGTEAFVERADYSAAFVVCDSRVDEHSVCMARGPIGIQDDDGEEIPGQAAAIREWNKAAALARRAQPEGEAPQAGWSIEKDAHGRFCVRDSGGARSITEEDEPTLYRFFSAQHAATLSPLCGAQHAESGKESVRQHEAIEVAVDQCYPKQDSPHASVNDKIGAARLAFRKGYRAALAAQQAAAPGAQVDRWSWSKRGMELDLNGHYAAYSAPGTPEAPEPTCMTEEQAEKWAWKQVKLDVGTDGWTAGDSGNYFGFFLWGWRYRAQYERQRDAAPKGGA